MGEQRALLSQFSTFAQTSSAVLCWSHWIDFEPFFSALRKLKVYSLNDDMFIYYCYIAFVHYAIDKHLVISKL